MRIVNCKVISVIICVLIGFVFVENIVLMLINYHLYNDVKLKSPADVFMNVVPRDVAGLTGNYTKVPIAVQRVLIEVVVNNSDVAGGRTRASVKSNKAHHSRDLSGIVSENHTLSRPLPPRLNDGENSTISLATNFTPFLDLLTNEDHNIISILKCWKNLTVPFLDKATPALRLIPPSFPAIPFYCKKYHKKNIECLKLESRGLSSWELNGNHIMLTVRTTTSLHASRLPLLFQTWMTAANRSNIFIVTDGRDKVLECRTREAGTCPLLPWLLSIICCHGYHPVVAIYGNCCSDDAMYCCFNNEDVTVIASISELCNCATRSHFALYVCMYVPMSVTLGPWNVPSDVICKHRARVAWLHGLCPRACRVVTWFARMLRGYMVCARVAWLHGLRACCVVTWFARVSRGYMVCTRVAWLHGLRTCRVVTWFARVSRCYMVCTRVAWLHGLRTCRVVTWFARVSRCYMVCACVAWLHGLHACRVVTWFARVSRCYMVCTRVAWLHGLRACRVVTWFARVSRGYMVCACVAWLHGLRTCRVVTWFARVCVSRGYTVCLALAVALPRVAGSASFNAVARLVMV